MPSHKKNLTSALRPRRQNRRISLQDIASKCSLSVMTVSRAINNAYGINPHTRERVLKVAREMGYIQNRLAANLSEQRTMTIGVVIPDIDHSIFPAIVKGLESALSAEGYRLFLCCSYDKPGKEYQEVQALLERCVDGVLLAPSSTAESRESVERLIQAHCPVVLMDRRLKDDRVDAVIYDDYGGAREAVYHLLSRGYRQIAHITGPSDVWTCAERLRGYRAALDEAGMAWQKEAVVECGLDIADGEAAMQRLMDRGLEIDAVFCFNDPQAIGACRTLQRRGLRIPRDMGLVGFSDTLESAINAIPLTTVQQDPALLGQHAASLLLGRISGEEEVSPRNIVLPTQLIPRLSTGADRS